MFTTAFWRLASERAIKSFAQSLVAILSVGGLGLLDIDWLTALSTAGMATLLSLLTSVGSLGVGPEDDPSMVNRGPAPPPPTASAVPTSDARMGAAV